MDAEAKGGKSERRYMCRIADVILETFVVDWVRILYVELYLGISVGREE